MPVCRLIFRLDFKKPNFDIIDRPGTVMRMLHDVPEKFWNNLSQNTTAHTISVIGQPEPQTLRYMTVDPTAISGSIDAVKGFNLKDLEKEESFSQIQKLISRITDEFKIADMKRGGLRIFYLDRLGNKPGDVQKAFGVLFDQRLVESVSEKLGDISDFCVSFDGEHEDKLKYRYRSGPYAAIEAGRHFHQSIVNEFKKDESNDFICELDLYEHDFALGSVGFAKWCRPVIKKMDDMLKTTKEIVKRQIGGRA